MRVSSVDWVVVADVGRRVFLATALMREVQEVCIEVTESVKDGSETEKMTES